MSQVVDEVLAANKKYASSFGAKKDLALPPAQFAILTCMDARLDPRRSEGTAPLFGMALRRRLQRVVPFSWSSPVPECGTVVGINSRRICRGMQNREAPTDKQRAGFWLDGQRAVLMALHSAEPALLAEHLGAVCPGNRLALLGRHLIDAQCFAAARAQRAENVRHAPDAVLVGDQHVIALPGQTVRPVEILDMPVDPHRMAAAVVAQQREIAGALFRDQNVAIRQHQQTSRVDEAGRERRCREAGRQLRGLSGVSDNERPVTHDRSRLRRRQTGWIDAEPPADLVFGKKILLQRVMLRVVLDAGLRARQASLPIDPPKRKRHNGRCSAPHK